MENDYVQATRKAGDAEPTEQQVQEAPVQERPTDEEIKTSQLSDLEQAREERNARLGIGNHTEDGPQPQSPVGGNLPGTLDAQGNRQEEEQE